MILRYAEILIIYVESEIGHDTGGSEEYYNNLIRRLEKRINQDRKSSELLFLIIVTNTPKRLAEKLSKFKERFMELGFEKAELGRDIYIVPALLYRELIPAILTRILSAVSPSGTLIAV